LHREKGRLRRRDEFDEFRNIVSAGEQYSALDLRALNDGDYDLKCVVALGDSGETATAVAPIHIKWDHGQQQVTLSAPKGEAAAAAAGGGTP